MKRPLLLSFLLTTSHMLTAQTIPTIRSVQLADSTVEQYGKFEAALDLTATFQNPYDYDQIVLSAVFTGPDGEQRTVDGFYMQDFTLNETTGALSQLGSGQFKVRFSPDQVGTWAYAVTVTDKNGTSAAQTGNFNVLSAGDTNNKGFVRANATHYLQFDNGEQYIPIGENMAWQNNNAYLNYRDWLTELQANGGNFFRLWHAHWGLGIEWRNGESGFQGLRRYHERNARYQDWLFDYCAENGIYVMLCLQHHGPVSTQVNPNWNDSPYNAANGGPAQRTWDFFTNEAARAHTRNRYRYILARWGYARSIMAWELFNEVEWTDDFTTHRRKVADWHVEMVAYLKDNDPYRHLVTTSYAHSNYDPEVWANPEIDFTQTHFYINTANIERALVSGVRNYLQDYGKPTLTGEFGLGDGNLANDDPDGVHLHNALWAGLFGGGLGGAMSWWWDNYIHPRDLYYHFAPLSTVAEQVPFLSENLAPTKTVVTGAPGDFILTPSLGWGVVGSGNIAIAPDGSTIPANPALSRFLYGSQWNTQFRSPPTFVAHFPQAAQFTVETANGTGTNPKIAIYIDGALVLEQAAVVNKTYTVNVPAGQHTIKVDNTGTDWIGIAGYTLGGIGSEVDAYALVSEARTVAAGWVLNHRYNHEFVKDNGLPEAVNGATLAIEGVRDGQYAVSWFDCQSGEMVNNGSALANNGQLQLAIPELYWDLAFLVNSDAVAVHEARPQVDFEVFPNPATAGQSVRIALTDFYPRDLTPRLYDASGKPLTVLSGNIRNDNELTVNLPDNLPPAMYWLHLEHAEGTGSRPFVVVR